MIVTAIDHYGTLIMCLALHCPFCMDYFISYLQPHDVGTIIIPFKADKEAETKRLVIA